MRQTKISTLKINGFQIRIVVSINFKKEIFLNEF